MNHFLEDDRRQGKNIKMVDRIGSRGDAHFHQSVAAPLEEQTRGGGLSTPIQPSGSPGGHGDAMDVAPRAVAKMPDGKPALSLDVSGHLVATVNPDGSPKTPRNASANQVPQILQEAVGKIGRHDLSIYPLSRLHQASLRQLEPNQVAFGEISHFMSSVYTKKMMEADQVAHYRKLGRETKGAPTEGCEYRSFRFCEEFKQHFNEPMAGQMIVYTRYRHNRRFLGGGYQFTDEDFNKAVRWIYHVVPVFVDQQGRAFAVEPYIDKNKPITLEEFFEPLLDKVSDIKVEFVSSEHPGIPEGKIGPLPHAVQSFLDWGRYVRANPVAACIQGGLGVLLLGTVWNSSPEPVTPMDVEIFSDPTLGSGNQSVRP